MSKIEQIQEVGKSRYEVITEVEKFNPYHDAKGRFSSADGATSFTYKPGQGAMYDNAIRRERERQAAMGPAPKENLVKSLGEKHATEVEKLMQDAPEEVRAVWDKYGRYVAVMDSHSNGRAYCRSGSVYLDIEKDAAGSRCNAPYETMAHESAHSIDFAIGRKVGYDFSVEHNGREFETSLKKEADVYIKTHQKKLVAERGTKVSIQEARDDLGKIMRKEGTINTANVSDMLEGATLGKFSGSAGHGKTYWTGSNTYWGKTKGHSVAKEAFAEMFAASATNKPSLAKIQEIFPESYKIFQNMCKEAAQL